MKEIVDDKDKMNFGGPLALVSRTDVEEICYNKEEGDRKEGLIMNSDDCCLLLKQ